MNSVGTSRPSRYDWWLAELSKQLNPLTVDARETARPTNWREWLTTCFPFYFTAPFAAHHTDFWEHVWAIKPEVRPKPMIAVWSRGGGKSSSLEPAVIGLGVHGGRQYALYVSASQDQADKHVESIATILESPEFAAQHPTFADRLVGKYGHSKGWRRSRLTTRAGFTIDAAGLDKAVRGIKREGIRPDVICFDDLDDVLDSPGTIQRKITTLTRSILPAGSTDVAILGVQNLIHQDSIFARFVDGRADFLTDRLVNGPIPAIEGLTYEQRQGKYWITGGTATWDGQSLEQCQALLGDIGLTSFLIECQHDVDESRGGPYEQFLFQYCEWADLPPLQRVVVWVDPAVTNTDKSDCQGIQADGLGVDDKLYRLYSWEGRTSPKEALRHAVLKGVELHAEHVGVETDQGGDLWADEYRQVVQELWDEALLTTEPPVFVSDKAGAGHGPKAHRQALMLSAYERGSIVHVRGTHMTLERALKRFGLRKPYDLADAAYWSWHELQGPPAQDVNPHEMQRIWREAQTFQPRPEPESVYRRSFFRRGG